MTIRAWRLVKARFADGAFSGEGARRFPGRWNHRGTPIVYLAGSLSLAALEILGNLDDIRLLKGYVSVRVSFDRRLCSTLEDRFPPPRLERGSSPNIDSRYWVSLGGFRGIMRTVRARRDYPWRVQLPAEPAPSGLLQGAGCGAGGISLGSPLAASLVRISRRQTGAVLWTDSAGSWEHFGIAPPKSVRPTESRQFIDCQSEPGANGYWGLLSL